MYDSCVLPFVHFFNTKQKLNNIFAVEPQKFYKQANLIHKRNKKRHGVCSRTVPGHSDALVLWIWRAQISNLVGRIYELSSGEIAILHFVINLQCGIL